MYVNFKYFKLSYPQRRYKLRAYCMYSFKWFINLSINAHHFFHGVCACVGKKQNRSIRLCWQRWLTMTIIEVITASSLVCLCRWSCKCLWNIRMGLCFFVRTLNQWHWWRCLSLSLIFISRAPGLFEIQNENIKVINVLK